jgi:hypothetical protein
MRQYFHYQAIIYSKRSFQAHLDVGKVYYPAFRIGQQLAKSLLQLFYDDIIPFLISRWLQGEALFIVRGSLC